jgi:hypothetical protein
MQPFEERDAARAEGRPAAEGGGAAPRGRRRWPRRVAIAVGVVVLLALALVLAVEPLLTWRTRRALADMGDYRGRFSDLEVSLRDLSYRLYDLQIEKLSAGGAAVPFFEAEKAELGLYWKELVRGHVVAGMRFEAPKLNLIAAKAKSERQAEDAPEVAEETGERLLAFRLDRLEIQDGEVLLVDRTTKGSPRLWLHDVEATVENFATRPALARGEPTVLALRGTLQRSGKVSVFATTDPLTKKLTFAGQARVEGLKLVELGEFIGAKTGLSPKGGTLDVSVRFQAKDGALSGGVRPILKDPEVDSAEEGIGAKLKAWLVDTALDIFSDDVPGRDAVATTIPIQGTVDAPKIQTIPTILGIVRNAFVVGLADSLENLPPARAREKQGTLEQARRALSRDEGPPRAQPARGEE